MSEDYFEAFAEWMKKVDVLAPPEEATRRLELCRACPDVVVMPVVGEVCDVCKCVMAAKTKLRSMSCPKEKWKAVGEP